jgi:hypothetical protein
VVDDDAVDAVGQDMVTVTFVPRCSIRLPSPAFSAFGSKASLVTSQSGFDSSDPSVNFFLTTRHFEPAPFGHLSSMMVSNAAWGPPTTSKAWMSSGEPVRVGVDDDAVVLLVLDEEVGGFVEVVGPDPVEDLAVGVVVRFLDVVVVVVVWLAVRRAVVVGVSL